MRLSITDKFLWDIYNVLHGTSEVMRFMLNPRDIKFMPGSQNPVFAKYRKEKGAREFAKLIYYLKRKNYIRIKDLEGKQAIILTKEGISKVLKASFALERKNRRKDGKWIMLTFDIPEKHKKARELLRSMLQNLEYKMFQQSIWITPYDVSEKTEKLLQFYNLDKYVKIFLTEEI